MRLKTIFRFGSIASVLGFVTAFLALTTGSAHADKNKGSGGGSNTFTVTGSMNVPHYSHKAVLLTTGQVLVVTGDTTGANTAELFNPATGTWTVTGTPAAFHEGGSATLLANGEVLLAGGDHPFCCSSTFTLAAELYNPSTGQWTGTGSMTAARRYHAAVRLPNGQVLVAGGLDPSSNSLASAELYDPPTGTWHATATMHNARTASGAELLGNGSVLVAGGTDYSNGGSVVSSLASAEIFNPSLAEWTSTASMPSPGGLSSLLANGDVLVVRDAFFTAGTGAWTATGPFPNTNTVLGPNTATLLGTGEVLMTGMRSTYNDTPTLNTTVLYNFATNAYTAGALMNSTRWQDAATLLPNGQVLISGGYVHRVGIALQPLSSAELYTP